MLTEDCFLLAPYYYQLLDRIPDGHDADFPLRHTTSTEEEGGAGKHEAVLPRASGTFGGGEGAGARAGAGGARTS